MLIAFVPFCAIELGGFGRRSEMFFRNYTSFAICHSCMIPSSAGSIMHSTSTKRRKVRHGTPKRERSVYAVTME